MNNTFIYFNEVVCVELIEGDLFLFYYLIANNSENYLYPKRRKLLKCQCHMSVAYIVIPAAAAYGCRANLNT